MEKGERPVILIPKAEQAILNICIYIAEQGYPETATRFYDRLYDFAETLGKFPDRYRVCRHTVLARHNLHCATFEHNYIFIYRIAEQVTVVFNIIHAKRLR